MHIYIIDTDKAYTRSATNQTVEYKVISIAISFGSAMALARVFIVIQILRRVVWPLSIRQ